MKVLNDCDNPPIGVVRHVTHAMNWISTADLKDLYCIQLVDHMPEVRDDTPESVKRNLAAGRLCPGQYIPRRGEYPAYITLFLDVTFRNFPSLYIFTPVPTLLLAAEIAHGVAYHVLATTGTKHNEVDEFNENEQNEKFAKEYVSKVLNDMQSRRCYRLGKYLIRDLADRYYKFGIRDWRAKRYVKAAEHWRKASVLNPDHKEAAEWYRRAKDMHDTQKRDPV
jgi:tetratricopeptide (TPR) repeat protein